VDSALGGSPIVKVYKFQGYDSLAGIMRVQPLMSPKERIEMVAGTIIPGTELEVDASELDEYGRYDPNKKRADGRT
jgi:hypothetical protein